VSHHHWHGGGALSRLPDNQREALLLVGAAGHSYVEVAEICGCAIGTIKSRVNRARRTLAATLCIDPVPNMCEASDVPVTKGGEEASQCAYALP
jgi:RNA polymerase sigma-70 factor (ECF subfamily)